MTVRMLVAVVILGLTTGASSTQTPGRDCPEMDSMDTSALLQSGVKVQDTIGETAPISSKTTKIDTVLCTDSEAFGSVKDADEFFRNACKDDYGYDEALCAGLASKVFEGTLPEDSWSPDTSLCSEFEGLLLADHARRDEQGLPQVVVNEASTIALLRKRSEESSGHRQSMESTLRFKHGDRAWSRRLR